VLNLPLGMRRPLLCRPAAISEVEDSVTPEEDSVRSRRLVLNSVPANAAGLPVGCEEVVARAVDIAAHANTTSRTVEHALCSNSGVPVATVACLCGPRFASVADNVAAWISKRRTLKPLSKESKAGGGHCRPCR
jgi:non-canonical (house-cleaning) NTP pyrophosphatase